jgi:hypothetical protein
MLLVQFRSWPDALPSAGESLQSREGSARTQPAIYIFAGRKIWYDAVEYLYPVATRSRFCNEHFFDHWLPESRADRKLQAIDRVQRTSEDDSLLLQSNQAYSYWLITANSQELSLI